MNIVDILEEKTRLILDGNDFVALTGEEMNILCDPIQLRAFKIYQGLPIDYRECNNVVECLEAIRNGDSLYRTLEYCVISNKALNLIRQYISFTGDAYVYTH